MVRYLAGMKLTIPDAENVILALEDEIRRSPVSRYDRRLHGILLVARGNSGWDVARLLGIAPRTVAYWVKRFEQEGPGGSGEEEALRASTAAERRANCADRCRLEEGPEGLRVDR